MITRLLVDNFRCFSNLEVRLGPQCLIIGDNGAGKTVLVEVLTRLQTVVVNSAAIEEAFPLFCRTRWRTDRRQLIELDVALKEGSFRYTLEIDWKAGQTSPQVEKESLLLDGRLLYAFSDQQAELVPDLGAVAEVVKYPLDPRRSGLSSVPISASYSSITAFRLWFATALFVKPLGLLNQSNQSTGESVVPGWQLQLFLNWYRRLTQESPALNFQFVEAIKEIIPGLTELRFEAFGPNSKALVSDHLAKDGTRFKLFFDEFSDGQRTLIALYAILYFAVGQGFTVFIDEPDNFVSLRELQPWLMELDRRQPDGSQYVLISHNPEVMNHFQLDEILHFRRLGQGIIRADHISSEDLDGLSLAESMSRGWFGE